MQVGKPPSRPLPRPLAASLRHCRRPVGARNVTRLLWTSSDSVLRGDRPSWRPGAGQSVPLDTGALDTDGGDATRLSGASPLRHLPGRRGDAYPQTLASSRVPGIGRRISEMELRTHGLVGHFEGDESDRFLHRAQERSPPGENGRTSRPRVHGFAAPARTIPHHSRTTARAGASRTRRPDSSRRTTR